MKLRTNISIKLFIFIVLTGLIPFIVFSVISVQKTRQATTAIIQDANRKTAEQLAGRIEQYLDNLNGIVMSLSQNFSQTRSDTQDQLQILRNYSINFPEFNYFHLVDRDGKVTLSSQVTRPGLDYEGDELLKLAFQGESVRTDVFMTKDLLPSIKFYKPIKSLMDTKAVLVAEIDLLHLWKLVEGLRIGKKGFVTLLTGEGRIFASGSGAYKRMAVSLAPFDSPSLLQAASGSQEKLEKDGEYLVSWVQFAKDPFFYVLVHQPKSEAFQLSYSLIRNLLFFAAAFIILVFVSSWFLGHRYVVSPIQALVKRIRRIGEGDLHSRIHLKGEDEFAALANTLNEMSQNILEREQELVHKETQAILGRMARGLAHDIKHPFTTIEMYTKALEYKYNDPEFRNLFIQTVKAQFESIHAFLDNLTQLSKVLPHEPRTIDLSAFLKDYASQMEIETKEKALNIATDIEAGIHAPIDEFSFKRAINNLVRNACEAMKPGGTLTLSLKAVAREGKLKAALGVQDTGQGIPQSQLENLFTDMKTTKKNGLGIGLTLTYRIIRQHSGEITVESRVGEGTRFTVFIPRIESSK